MSQTSILSSLKAKSLYKDIFLLLIKSNQLFSLLKNKQTDIISYTKNKTDKLTNFDWSIQKKFESKFEKDYPFFDFFFEEDTSIDIHEKLLGSDLCYTNNLLDFSFLDKLIDEKDDIFYGVDDKFCLYLDPLDATWSFINHDFKSVSIIIGVTLNDIPLFGFIHSPMYTDSESYTSKTVFNIKNKGVYEVIINGSNYNINKLHSVQTYPSNSTHDNQNKYSIIIPNSSSSKLYSIKQQLQLINSNVQSININGYGNLLSYYITKSVDLLYVPYKRLGYWDMCGSNAILKEFGGGIANLKGEEMKYPSHSERGKSQFREGINEYTICYKRRSDLEEVIKDLNGFEF